MAKVPRPVKPTDHAPYDNYTLWAVQAVAEGKATEGQQQQALKWIIEQVCGAYDRSFVPGEPEVTAFREGRRDVGRQIVKALQLKATKEGMHE